MIDSQHKELIGRINDLLRSCEEEADLRAAVKMLNYLADYTEYHFGEEEALQAAIGYPGIEEHKKKHEELRKTVEELHEMLEEQEGPTKAFVEQVRGVDCSGVIGSLVQKALIEERGRLDLPGKPLLYGTTENFLRCMGIRSLLELPPLPQEEETENAPQNDGADKA